ncbi:MAG: Na+/H+ antiporter subunit E [Alphaproteobacteria bacterium]
MKLYIRLAIILGLLWWILSGKAKLLMLVFAIFSIVTVLFFTYRMRKESTNMIRPQLSWRFIPYFFWLLWETIKANIDVAKTILGIGDKLNPQIFDAYAHEETEAGTIAYANSITLTPGTITVALVDGRLTVHALTEEAKNGLIEGNMDRMVHWAETGRPITEKVEGEQ